MHVLSSGPCRQGFVRLPGILRGWWCILAQLLFLGQPASALNATNVDIIFGAYNTAFYTNSGGSGYYKDTTAGGQTYFWGQAEEIEMALDAYDRTEATGTKAMISALCNGFIAHNGTDWTWNEYNDDIAWAVIAFSRAYGITGNTTFRDRAKANFDAMYSRAWDTAFTGGGLWWRQSDKQSKNACINGPAAIGACYLYQIFGDATYLAKAQACYDWERRVLFQTNSGAVYDNLNTNNTYNTWAGTYNEGTSIGAANLLYQLTGLPFYYQDALLAANYTKNNLCSAGILPVYSSGDLAGFNGIFARWMGKFGRDQDLWNTFSGWMTTNADAAWNVRNTNNLSWYNWKNPTPAGTNILNSWDCVSSAVMVQVGCTNTPDALRLSPEAGFTAVAPYGWLPGSNSTALILTNASASAFAWSVGNTSSWLGVSATVGALAAGATTNVTIRLNPVAVTNLPVGRYSACVWLTNLTSSAIQKRGFALIVSRGNTPLTLTGCNARIIAPNTATVSVPNASAFDLVNGYAFYQAGLGASTRGMPPNGVFTSQLDSNTVFQIGPYGVTNALVMGYAYPKYGTVGLQTPQACNSLAILAASASAPAAGGIGTFLLNFTNGTRSQVFNFYAPDWFASSNNVAIQGVGRYQLSTGAIQDNGPVSPRLFQTTLDLAALGINQTIDSITFSNSTSAGATQVSAILAVSARPMPPEPNFVRQPTSITNTLPAEGAVFTVIATGQAPLNYQWYYSASGVAGTYTALAGQTNASLVLSPELQLTNAGKFFVTAVNTLGAATSSVASLVIYRAPVIAQQPAPTTLFAFTGTTRSFSVVANAAQPLWYRWLANGEWMPQATNATCTLPNLQVTNSGLYTVIISNAYGSVTSTVASLTVLPAPNYPYGQAMRTNGAIGYWRLDETGGSVARDCLGTNNGVYTGNVFLGQPGYNWLDTHPSARFGYLAASNSCVTNISVDFATATTAAFSVEAWVNGSAQTSDAGIITKGYGSGGEQFNLDCGGSGHGFRFFVRDATGSAHLASSSITPDGRWHHVVGVCDQANGQVFLYVDGTNVATGTIGITSGILSSALPMSIGARQSGTGKPYDFQFVGYLEEAAVYGVALGSNQIRAHFGMASNQPPVFAAHPLVLGSVSAGQNLTGTLAAYAADPNGDALTFTKLSGPAWLSLAANGTLTGRPVSADLGTNSVQVRVTDPAGLSDATTLYLQILPAPPILATLSLQPPNLWLTWTGGIAPYDVLVVTNPADPNWQPVQSSLSASNLILLPTNPGAWYRIRGQ